MRLQVVVRVYLINVLCRNNLSKFVHYREAVYHQIVGSVSNVLSAPVLLTSRARIVSAHPYFA